MKKKIFLSMILITTGYTTSGITKASIDISHGKSNLTKSNATQKTVHVIQLSRRTDLGGDIDEDGLRDFVREKRTGRNPQARGHIGSGASQRGIGDEDATDVRVSLDKPKKKGAARTGRNPQTGAEIKTYK